MGSMKDLLGENPPTIGDCRRQGMRTFSVHCAAPCGRVMKLTLDALGLPDETVFIDIPRKRRLICQGCGRRAREVSASWTEVPAYGNRLRSLVDWIVVARTPAGEEVRSSAMPSRERALGLAFDMADQGDAVLRIEGPGGDVTADEVAQERAARRR